MVGIVFKVFTGEWVLVGIDRQTGHTPMETGVPLQAFRVFTGEWVWVGIDHQHQAGGIPSETGGQVFKVSAGGGCGWE